MSVIARTLKPAASAIVKLLTLDAGTVNSVVSMNIHNQGTTTDVVRIWVSTTETLSGSTPPPEADLIDTVSLEQLETLRYSCGHLAPNEMVWIQSTTGNSSFRAAALVELN